MNWNHCLKQTRNWIGVGFLMVFLLLLGQQQASAQVPGKRPFWNKALEQIALPDSKEGWIEFREDSTLQRKNLFTLHREAFKIGAQDEMREQKSKTDAQKYSHSRYDQYHKGVRIVGAQFVVHEDAKGKLVSANGNLAEDLNLDASPGVSEKNALLQALKHVNLDDARWKKPDKTIGAQIVKASTYDPKGALVFYPKKEAMGLIQDNLALAWSFDLHMDQPSSSVCVVIDAKTGQLLDQYPLDVECDPGTVATPWYGNHSMQVDQQVSGGVTSYILLDNCNSHPYSIHTYVTVNGDLREIRSGNNIWSSSPTEIAGGTVHWGLQRTRNYFRNTHSHNSWDDDNANIVASILPGVSNAYWSGGDRRLGFGTGSGADNSNDDYTTLDIVGHEFTHAVTQSSAGLRYRRQSGALNESFSDIFGELVERYTRGSNDWLVGGDRPSAIRNMAQVRAYGDARWIDTEDCTPSGGNDQCGVHTNSGVQNHWFYLLCEGGSGTNFAGREYSVQAINMDRAAAIVYLALTGYLTENADYLDARQATLWAARQLYGSCSNEAIQVGRAWFAVNVGPELAIFDENICGTRQSGFWQGINSLRSGGNNCNTTVSASSNNVSFAAGNFIVLGPQFRATAGGDNRFLAYIRSCSFTLVPASAIASEEETAVLLDLKDVDQELELEKTAAAKPHSLSIQPNPLISTAQIVFELPVASHTIIDLFDVNGRLVRNVFQGQANSGINTLPLDALDLQPGVYICRMLSGTSKLNTRLVITR
jgi:bacillolysin